MELITQHSYLRENISVDINLLPITHIIKL